MDYMDYNPNERFWEVDFLRGAAVLAMIFYHALYDLEHFGVRHVDVFSGFWLHFAQATAATFVLLVGVSLSLRAARARKLGKADDLWKKLFRRGLKIFALGLGITAITYALFRDGFIIFGVLHFIGLSVMLAYPFLRLGSTNLLIGMAVIFTGLQLQTMTFDIPWLLWFGLMPDKLYTFDYFPIFPWFGLILIGIFLGESLYRNYDRRIYLPDISASCPAEIISLIGRNSLSIYLIHQPAIIALLYFMGLTKISVISGITGI